MVYYTEILNVCLLILSFWIDDNLNSHYGLIGFIQQSIFCALALFYFACFLFIFVIDRFRMVLLLFWLIDLFITNLRFVYFLWSLIILTPGNFFVCVAGEHRSNSNCGVWCMIAANISMFNCVLVTPQIYHNNYNRELVSGF